jgi:hypothetical protein
MPNAASELGRGLVENYSEYPNGGYYTINYLEYNKCGLKNIKKDRFPERYVISDKTNYSNISYDSREKGRPLNKEEQFNCYLYGVKYLTQNIIF